jgi:hypothetical protein
VESTKTCPAAKTRAYRTTAESRRSRITSEPA